jgi:hypothetical protein
VKHQAQRYFILFVIILYSSMLGPACFSYINEHQGRHTWYTGYKTRHAKWVHSPAAMSSKKKILPVSFSRKDLWMIWFSQHKLFKWWSFCIDLHNAWTVQIYGRAYWWNNNKILEQVLLSCLQFETRNDIKKQLWVIERMNHQQLSFCNKEPSKTFLLQISVPISGGVQIHISNELQTRIYLCTIM